MFLICSIHAMSTESTPSPAPAAPQSPALVADTALATGIDEYGYNLDDYDWVPVLRKRRVDGWTHTRQRKFIEVLADTGSVKRAAREADMSEQSCYRLRRAPGAENFARAWDAAIDEASHRLIDIAFDRAVNGVTEKILDKNGDCIATKSRYNDRLLMFLLRAHKPDRYAHAHREGAADQLSPPAPTLAVAHAIERLEPAALAAPHLTVTADELPYILGSADVFEGELPPSMRDGPGDCKLTMTDVDPSFDRKIERMKKNAHTFDRELAAIRANASLG